MNLKAVIFDLDGTVLKNEAVYAQAFSEVLESIGVKDHNKTPQIGGVGTLKNWQHFFEKYGLKNKTSKAPEDLAQKTQEIYLQNLDDVTLREGFFEFVQNLKNSNIKTALATSNDKKITDKILEKFHIKDQFNVVVTIEDVSSPKPSPEIFKKATDLLGENPLDCLVVEDAQSGVDAAKVLSMKVLGIKSASETGLKNTDAQILNFGGLTKDSLIELLKN